MASNGVLVDTGPLVALLSETDQYHQTCVAAAKSIRGPLYTTWPVFTETTYLLRRRLEAVLRLLELMRDGELTIVELTGDDLDDLA